MPGFPSVRPRTAHLDDSKSEEQQEINQVKTLLKVMPAAFLFICVPSTAQNVIEILHLWIYISFSHLTADTKRLQWVEAEPPSVPSLFETVHKLSVECPLQGRQTHQDHMFLFRGQLVSQDVMTLSRMKKNIWSVRVKNAKSDQEEMSHRALDVGSSGLTSAQNPPGGYAGRGSCTSSAGCPQACCPHTAHSEWDVQTCY